MNDKKLLTASNSPPPHSMGITIKSPQELEIMRRAGQVVGKVLEILKETIRPGMKTRDLDLIASQEIHQMGATPVFKGYRGFPATICTSINEEIVHGIPGNRVIREGDLVKLDVGARVDGFIGDAAITVSVEKVSPEAQALVKVTKQALDEGISAAREGAHVGDIGAAIEHFVESSGYRVVREYVGHGVGRALHEEPQIPNYGTTGQGALLRKGMVIAIEPMVNLGDWRTRVLEDAWTVVTADSSLSAHFEHTISITDGIPDILTSP